MIGHRPRKLDFMRLLVSLFHLFLLTFLAGCYAGIDPEGGSTSQPPQTRQGVITSSERLMLGSGSGFAQSENFKMYGGVSSAAGGSASGEQFQWFGLDAAIGRQFLQEETFLRGDVGSTDAE